VNANHVIFISPLLAESQHAFNESRIQCIGRARRYGQLKKVHVYDFLALHSIDVDITEDQRCKHLVREKLVTGEEDWKLMVEEEMTDKEKAQNWGSGWKRKDLFEE
jgi:SNF2 family DNA or RNA helicase